MKSEPTLFSQIALSLKAGLQCFDIQDVVCFKIFSLTFGRDDSCCAMLFFDRSLSYPLLNVRKARYDNIKISFGKCGFVQQYT
jgi:hypothetical protein